MKQVYDACPYCLTAIAVENDTPVVGSKEDLLEEVDKGRSSEFSREEVQKPSTPEVHGCAHNFGYLSQRSSKEKIPDECMVCENIVQCMLRKVTS